MLLLLRVRLRVLVKDWKGGQIGEDGPFIYDETPKSKSEADKAYDGHEEDGTTWVEPQTNAVWFEVLSEWWYFPHQYCYCRGKP